MESFRTHGKPPYCIAVLHGGPGAPGEMAPVAQELSGRYGVIEPLQSGTSIEGQVKELKEILDEIGSPPITMIGWSFGAWLGFIFAASYPSMLRKLIMIGSGPFGEEYASGIMETRMERLSEKERSEVRSIVVSLDDPDIGGKDDLLMRFAVIISGADSFDPLDHEGDLIRGQYDVFRAVWEEASRMRRDGSLLEMGRKIHCPITAIHGDHDPHPSEGVLDPLTDVIHDFRFILMEKCGHKPWIERSARDVFYRILMDEIRNDVD